VKLRGGQILARALQEKGVSQVFTLSGGFCNPALEGFMECGIPVINAPSEQVAALRTQRGACDARSWLLGGGNRGNGDLL
jgi:hypothetical protein